MAGIQYFPPPSGAGNYVTVALPELFGAKADAHTVTDGVMTGASNVLASTAIGASSTPPTVGQKIVITPVPIWGKISSTLSTGAAITALPVQALKTAIPSGATLTVRCGANTQTWTTTAITNVGDTSIAVASQTPSFAFPGSASAIVSTGSTPYSTVEYVQAPIKTTVTAVSSGNVTVGAAAPANGIARAVVVYGTDNYTALTNWLAYAAANNRVAYVPKAGLLGEGYLYDGLLTVSVALDIKGEGVSDLTMTAGPDGNNPSTCTNDVTPWISGSVLIQAALNTDGLKLTGKGVSNNLRDFGIRFAPYHNSTGHGINVQPPTLSTYQDHGQWGSEWSGIKIHGHDGSHYAFNVVNPSVMHLSHLRSYGGGMFNFYNNSSVWYYGNSQFDDCFGALICAGTAHGINLDGSANFIQLCQFNRQQIMVQNAGYSNNNPGNMPLPTPPTGGASGQLGLNGTAFARRITFIEEDFETGVGALMVRPIQDCEVINAVQALNPVTGWNPGSVSGTAYRNTTGRSMQLTSLFTLSPTSGAAATVDIYVGKSNPPTSGGNHIVTYSQPANANGTTFPFPVTFIVPAGWYYQVNLVNGSTNWQWQQGPLDSRGLPN